MNIRTYYLENYPTDDLGTEINKEATFLGLYNELINKRDVYEYLHVSDSLVRERVFDKLASLLKEPYQYIYTLWIEPIINS